MFSAIIQAPIPLAVGGKVVYCRHVAEFGVPLIVARIQAC